MEQKMVYYKAKDSKALSSMHVSDLIGSSFIKYDPFFCVKINIPLVLHLLDN